MTPLEAFTIVKDFLDDMRDGTCKSVPMRYTDSYIYLEQNCYPQIEAALKELEGIKNGSIRLSVESGENYVAMPKYQYEQDLKKLKALEIIKEKEVDIFYIKMCFSEFYGFERYNQLQSKEKQLTREEYDLLKEVLL